VTQVAPIETTTPAFHLDTNGEVPPPTPAMLTVKLDRHYRPMEDPDPNDKTKRLPPVFEVVGYWKDEIKRKNPAGQEVVIQKREFIKGEAKPPVQAGTGSATKLLAGTVVKLRKSEAKYVRDNAIGTIEIDED
jgi:hypothetical protein